MLNPNTFINMILKKPICNKKERTGSVAATKTPRTAGIPTGTSKEDIKAREKIISDFYRNWYAKHLDKKVFNIHLNEYINVLFLSITETKRHAAKSYLSTLAVLQLDSVLATAKQYGKPHKPKIGVKNQEDFSSIIEMHCKLYGIGEVKMTVGVKRKTNEKIQYCVTVIQT